MIGKMMALATAATISLGAIAPAHAMEQERNMLRVAIENELERWQLDTTNIDNLTLHEVVELNEVFENSSMSEEQVKVRAMRILEEAGNR